MLIVEVEKTVVKEVVKKSTGEVFRIPEVHAYLHGLDRYPQAIQFGLAKDAPHPAPGKYEVAMESFFIGAPKFSGQRGVLSLRENLVLRPVIASAKAA